MTPAVLSSMRSVGVSHSSLPGLLGLNTGTGLILIVLSTFASVPRSAGQIQIYNQSPSKARTLHGIISNDTNEYADDPGKSATILKPRKSNANGILAPRIAYY